MSTKDENPQGKAADNRKLRLKQALRANLRRRKADNPQQADETGISRRADPVGAKDRKQ